MKRKKLSKKKLVIETNLKGYKTPHIWQDLENSITQENENGKKLKIFSSNPYADDLL